MTCIKFDNFYLNWIPIYCGLVSLNSPWLLMLTGWLFDYWSLLLCHVGLITGQFWCWLQQSCLPTRDSVQPRDGSSGLQHARLHVTRWQSIVRKHDQTHLNTCCKSVSTQTLTYRSDLFSQLLTLNWVTMSALKLTIPSSLADLRLRRRNPWLCALCLLSCSIEMIWIVKILPTQHVDCTMLYQDF